MKATAADSRLVFDTVSVSIKNKDILHSINGVANSGELLAVMGPTGSGKTTLLNVISGRIPIKTGQVTLNGRPMTKTLRRRVAYVLQDDFFLSNLTLYETLYFTAMIRIPDTVEHSEKLTRIDEIVNALHIRGCLNTRSGKTTLLNVLAGHIPKVSGSITLDGVPLRKASRRKVAYVIQNDIFLTNLTLYETLYFTAMLRIPEYVSHSEKMARIDEIVDALNIRGCMNTVIGTFLDRGLSGGEKKRASIACELLTDPDIMLIDEPTSGLDSSTAYKLMQQLVTYATNFNKTIVTTIHQPSSQIYHLFCTLLLLENGRTVYFGKASDVVTYFEDLGFPCQPDYNPADYCLELLTSNDDVISIIRQSSMRLTYFGSELDGNDMDSAAERPNAGHSSHKPESYVYTIELGDAQAYNKDKTTKETTKAGEQTARVWPNSFWAQYKILTWRNYRQAKGRIIDRKTTIQALIVGLVGGLVYFQIPDTLDTFRDRMGLLFATVLHWGMQVAVVTIIGFPGEREVVTKERRAGAYRLSAYYLAKISSELPLLAVIPILFYSAMYWMSMLGDVSQFFVFLGINLMSCLCIQGVGHVVGAVIVDNKDALVISHTSNVTFIILAGFYSTHLPPSLNWMKYISLMHYPIAAMTTIILADREIFPCNETSLETFKLCEKSEFLSKEELLASYGIEVPVHCCLSILAILIVLAKVLGYFALKWKHV